MKVTEKTWYPILYMFIITLFFTAILILFGNFTRERVNNNARIAFERAVLQVLPAGSPAVSSPADIHRRYIENIQEPDSLSAGAYRYSINDTIAAYVLPIAGPGFWAPVAGVIGIAADKKTVISIAFYKQEETPGLGGEIANPPFRSQFISKKLSATGTPLEFRMPGEELDEHSVHTITGATQTSQRVGKFLNARLTEWQRTIGSRE